MSSCGPQPLGSKPPVWHTETHERVRQSSVPDRVRIRTRAFLFGARAWLWVLPAVLGLVFFVALPFILAVLFSFSNLRTGSPLALEFVGLREYARIVQDPTLLRALLNNLIFALVVVPTQTGLALILALLLSRSSLRARLFRTTFFLPVVFPMSLVAVVWTLMFAPGQSGMFNAALRWLSFGQWADVDFLHHPYWALPAVMLVSVWQGLGFQMVVLVAGLQSIPQQLYDAARVDGAGHWQTFFYVTLPGLKNPMIFVVTVTTLLSFRVFDPVRIMTQGGPNDASTTMIFEAVRAAFDRGQISRSSAITVVLLGVVLLVAALQGLLQRKGRGPWGD